MPQLLKNTTRNVLSVEPKFPLLKFIWIFVKSLGVIYRVIHKLVGNISDIGSGHQNN